MIDTRLAHYQIELHLGSGGMGEVYQAVDSKLGRSVAIKFLPESFSHDTKRLSRFQREARVLASLNHSNIAAIYGLEESQGRKFLVMELVPGDTLGQRIKSGAMPLVEALAIARQMAEAIEAAHEKGIVHRDLKPANVMIRPDGQVKVLDFGLAKFGRDGTEESNEEDLSSLPTASSPATEAGVILGTVRYMAPEQAKGQQVDGRADIFAFGCVLYEMLAGRPAFEGENSPEILSRILQSEPDWTRLPGNLSPSLQRLIRLCLEKDPRKRRQSAGDIRIDLDPALMEPAAAPPAPGHRSPFVRLAWISGVAVLAAALAIPAALHLRESPPAEMRLQVVTPSTLDPLHFALAPDGKYLVFVASGSPNDASQRLYLRAIDNSEAKPLAGTESARFPFWSADSRSIGFFAAGKLFRLDIADGSVQELATAANPRGGAWSVDNTILFSPNTVSPLLSIPASGGRAVAVTKIDSPRQSGHQLPSFLPDGRRFLFHAIGDAEGSGIYLGSLGEEAPKRLIAAISEAAYLAPDLVVYAQQGTVVARKLNAERGELTDDPVTIVAGDRGSLTRLSISNSGIVAYRSGAGAVGRLTWFDRKGAVLGRGGDLNAPELSRDGRYVAYDRTVAGNRDVWILDILRDALVPFTRHPAVDGFPVWSPDGSRIAFHSQRRGTFDVWIKPVNESSAEELLIGTSDNEWPLDWSKDGRFLLYQKSDQNYTSTDLWAFPMNVAAPAPIVVANTPFEERMGEFSPDARWIAYETEEFGRPEIVVRAFPEPGGVVHVSTNGGVAPRWSADGKEIYFVAPDGKMMAVAVTAAGPTLTPGKPQPLFSTQIVPQPFKFQYAVSRDGRFLLNSRFVDESAITPITLILNWKHPAK